jgi:hypothetical protein
MSAVLHTPTELKVVAVVNMNGGEALVLNRPLRYIYDEHGKDLIGVDGPFRDVLKYERGGGRFVAFAGRAFTLTMRDGSTRKIKDHWWSAGLKGSVSVAVGDVDSLKKCYVYTGANSITPEALAELRATYTGCVYPYWDYEKVIKYDDVRRDLWHRAFHEERRRNALVAAVKAKHRELRAALSKATSQPSTT